MDDGDMPDRDTVKAHYEQEADYHDILYEESADRYPTNILRGNITRDLIEEAEDVETVVDIGCGTGHVMIDLLDDGYEVYGFDFAANMVEEARANLSAEGFDPDRVRQGDFTEEIPFNQEYDAAVALGVLPHFEDIRKPLSRFKEILRNGGMMVAQLRNDLFDLYTFNEHTYEFVRDELLADVSLEDEAAAAIDDRLREALNLEDGVGESAGDADFSSGEHQYFHNPLTVEEHFRSVGFSVQDVLFYHYHAMLPEFETEFREEFYEQSLELENPRDWRGHFLASAFLAHARVR